MRRSWRYGCVTALALAGVAAIVLGVAATVAWRQSATAELEHHERVHDLEPPAGADAARRPVRLALSVHTATVSLRPADAGEAIRVDADYDPRRYRLRQTMEREGAVDLLTVELRPRGSELMALLRTKVGGRPPALRIAIPRDVPLAIDGELERGFGALELGGLAVTSTSLDVADAGVKVSFSQPLPAPMDSLRVVGNRGSLSVSGLGNASPRESVLFQHIGAVDLDLRGPWSRDARVRVISGAAGGLLWLPDDVTVTGYPQRFATEPPERPGPTLDLSVEEHLGRIVVVD